MTLDLNNLDIELKYEDNIPFIPVSIKVVGVGGCGNNIVTYVKEKGIKGAETIAINTDIQQLYRSKADKKILIGRNSTRGLGSGGDMKKGELAARESIPEIKQHLEGADLVYISAGLGGGTGSGGAPVVAEVAKNLGALTIGFVTIPFRAEGSKRMEKAQAALLKLKQFVDGVIVIDNNRILELYGNRKIQDAFNLANEIIATTINGIVETIVEPQLMNLDFADVKSVMEMSGVCVVGIGESRSDNRAKEAVRKALHNPLLDVKYEGAKGAIIYVEGGEDLMLEELNIINEEVNKLLKEDSEVFLGARINPKLEDMLRVILIIAGVKSPYIIGKDIEEEELESSNREDFERFF